MSGKSLSRRLILIVALTILCFWIFAIPVSADSTSGSWGNDNVITWDYDSDTHTLTLSGEGQMEDGNVPEKVSEALDIASWDLIINKLVINEGITAVGANAFRKCPGLKEITFPESLVEVGAESFYGCSDLTQLNLPENLEVIGDYAFGALTGIKELTIPSSVRTLGDGAFAYLNNLGEIIIPATVEEWGESVFVRAGLEKVTFEEGIKIIPKSLFTWCEKIKEVTIPSSVEEICLEAFHDNKSLEKVTFSPPEEGSESNLKIIRPHVFWGCYSLKEINIPDSVTVIMDMAFYDCPILSDVHLPDNLETLGLAAFGNCPSLETINFPSALAEIGEHLFIECPKLKAINVPEDNEYFQDIDGVLFSKDQSVLYEYPEAKGTSYAVPEGTEKIAFGAFSERSSLMSVTLPEGLTNIGEFAFSEDPSLTEIILPDSLTYIGSFAFYECTSLQEVALPKNLETIDEYAFSNDTALQSVSIPQSVNSIGGYAFNGCSSLAEVTINDGVEVIGDGCFGGCISLENIYLPSSVKEIGQELFNGCSSLKEAFIPESIRVIRYGMFKDASMLTTITLPAGITSIEEDAFSGADSLKEIFYGGSEGDWNAIDINSYGNDPLSRAAITYNYVSNSIVNALVDRIPRQKYTGEAIEPELIVRLNGHVLEKDTDYSVTFENNIEIGTAQAIIKGIGDYTGEKTVNFFITEEGETIVTDGVCGKDLTWHWDQANSTLTISGAGDMYDFWYYYLEDLDPNDLMDPTTYIPWITFNDQIRNVIISEGVTSVGNFAFYECSHLINVSLPDTVTRIGDSSFYECSIITTITLPGELREIGYSAFSECSAIKNIVIPEKVRTIGEGAFSGTAITSFTFPEGIKRIEPYMFSFCYGLKEVTIPSSVTYIGKHAFSDLLTLLETVHYGGTEKQWDAIEICEGNEALNNAYIEYSENFEPKEKQNITISVPRTDLAVGKSLTLSQKGAMTNVTYVSSNKSIASISGNKLTAKKVGTVTVTVKSYGDDRYEPAQDSIKIKIVPAAPKNLKAENTAESLKLTWSEVDGATKYYLYRGTTLIKKLSSSKLSYTDSKASENGKKYTYKVMAYGSTGLSYVSKSVVAYRLAKPSIKSLTNTKSKQVTVKYGKNAKATGYVIEYSTSNKFTSKKTATVKKAATVSKVIKSLTKNKTYYFRIRSYKTVSGTKYYSAYSDIKKIKIGK